ncbi:hypothetical protein HDV00_010295 [Rhizophlyctis rosea]|nr:hypothetical protein HDV00_010295 [Rhizophlyctis rosea]
MDGVPEATELAGEIEQGMEIDPPSFEDTYEFNEESHSDSSMISDSSDEAFDDDDNNLLEEYDSGSEEEESGDALLDDLLLPLTWERQELATPIPIPADLHDTAADDWRISVGTKYPYFENTTDLLQGLPKLLGLLYEHQMGVVLQRTSIAEVNRLDALPYHEFLIPLPKTTSPQFTGAEDFFHPVLACLEGDQEALSSMSLTSKGLYRQAKEFLWKRVCFDQTNLLRTLNTTILLLQREDLSKWVRTVEFGRRDNQRFQSQRSLGGLDMIEGQNGLRGYTERQYLETRIIKLVAPVLGKVSCILLTSGCVAIQAIEAVMYHSSGVRALRFASGFVHSIGDQIVDSRFTSLAEHHGTVILPGDLEQRRFSGDKGRIQMADFHGFYGVVTTPTSATFDWDQNFYLTFARDLNMA